MPIQAVLLDVGGVLHLPDHGRVLGTVTRLGLAPDRGSIDRAHYAGVAALHDVREGDRAVWLAYFRAYASALGATDGDVEDVAEALLAEFTTGDVWTRIVPGSRDALAAIAATGVRIAIVSNSDGTVEDRLRLEGLCQVGAGRGVEVAAVLDSSVVGVAKPDPHIFELALDALGGVDPTCALHVGDIPAADVAGAHGAGVHPVLVDPYDDHAGLEVTRVRSLGEVPALLA